CFDDAAIGMELPAARSAIGGDDSLARPNGGAACLRDVGEDAAVLRTVDAAVARTPQPARDAVAIQPGHEAPNPVGLEHLRSLDAELLLDPHTRLEGRERRGIRREPEIADLRDFE